MSISKRNEALFKKLEPLLPSSMASAVIQKLKVSSKEEILTLASKFEGKKKNKTAIQIAQILKELCK